MPVSRVAGATSLRPVLVVVVPGLLVPLCAVTPAVLATAIEVAFDTADEVSVPVTGVAGESEPPKLNTSVPVPAPLNAALIEYPPVETVVVSPVRIEVATV